MLYKINLHCAINLSRSTNKIQNYRLQVGGLRVHSYVGEKSNSLRNNHRCSLYYLRGQAVEDSPNLPFQRSGFVKRTLTRSSPQSPGDSLYLSPQRTTLLTTAEKCLGQGQHVSQWQEQGRSRDSEIYLLCLHRNQNRENL